MERRIPTTLEEALTIIEAQWQMIEALQAQVATVAALQAQVATVTALETEVTRLQGRVVELEARLRQNSSNSSRPPSSDGPGSRPPRSGRRSRKKRGGQPGHEPHHRELLGPDRLTGSRDVFPEQCRRCGKALEGIDPGPYRHQVVELPEGRAMADETRVHSLPCTCGVVTSAGLPDGVPDGGYGPRLVALVGTLASGYRLSHRLIVQLLADLYDLRLGLGTVAKLEQRASEEVAEAVDEAHAFVKAQPALFVDETGWTESKRKAWLWTAQAAQLVAIAGTRRPGAEPRPRDSAGSIVSWVSAVLEREGGEEEPLQWMRHERLRRALWDVAEHKDESARRRLHEALLATDVLVVARTGQTGVFRAGDEIPFLCADDPRTGPLICAFSDLEAAAGAETGKHRLDLMDPRQVFSIGVQLGWQVLLNSDGPDHATIPPDELAELTQAPPP